MTFWHAPAPGERQLAMTLTLEGEYERLPNGDLRFRSPYAQADVVLRPLPDGRVTQVSSNIHMDLREIRPR